MKKKILRLFQKSDLFAKNVAFRENRGDSFTSCYGATISILITIITCVYATNKIIILKERDDSTISQYTADNALDEDMHYYNETDFFIALGLKSIDFGTHTNIFDYFDIMGL